MQVSPEWAADCFDTPGACTYNIQRSSSLACCSSRVVAFLLILLNVTTKHYSKLCRYTSKVKCNYQALKYTKELVYIIH